MLYIRCSFLTYFYQHILKRKEGMPEARLTRSLRQNGKTVKYPWLNLQNFIRQSESRINLVIPSGHGRPLLKRDESKTNKKNRV